MIIGTNPRSTAAGAGDGKCAGAGGLDAVGVSAIDAYITPTTAAGVAAGACDREIAAAGSFNGVIDIDAVIVTTGPRSAAGGVDGEVTISCGDDAFYTYTDIAATVVVAG